MIGESSIKEKPLTHDVNNIPATSPHFITSQLPHNTPSSLPTATTTIPSQHQTTTKQPPPRTSLSPSNQPQPTKNENTHRDHHPQPRRHEPKPAIKTHIHNLKTTKTNVTQEIRAFEI
jgi:hypothetical protein